MLEQVIDNALALHLAGNNKDLAKEIMNMLFEHLPEHKRIIDQAFKENDLPALLKEVHKLHGATCYCGTPRLKTTMEQFETALRSKQPANTLQDIYKTFCKEVDALMLARKNRS